MADHGSSSFSGRNVSLGNCVQTSFQLHPLLLLSLSSSSSSAVIIIIFTIIIIIGSTSLGEPSLPRANVASVLSHGQPPANSYNVGCIHAPNKCVLSTPSVVVKHSEWYA
jgi:hypothetical protein